MQLIAQQPYKDNLQIGRNMIANNPEPKENSQTIFECIYERGVGAATETLTLSFLSPTGILKKKPKVRVSEERARLSIIAKILCDDVCPHFNAPFYWEQRLVEEAKVRGDGT